MILKTYWLLLGFSICIALNNKLICLYEFLQLNGYDIHKISDGNNSTYYFRELSINSTNNKYLVLIKDPTSVSNQIQDQTSIPTKAQIEIESKALFLCKHASYPNQVFLMHMSKTLALGKKQGWFAIAPELKTDLLPQPISTSELQSLNIIKPNVIAKYQQSTLPNLKEITPYLSEATTEPDTIDGKCLYRQKQELLKLLKETLEKNDNCAPETLDPIIKQLCPLATCQDIQKIVTDHFGQRDGDTQQNLNKALNINNHIHKIYTATRLSRRILDLPTTDKLHIAILIASMIAIGILYKCIKSPKQPAKNETPHTAPETLPKEVDASAA